MRIRPRFVLAALLLSFVVSRARAQQPDQQAHQTSAEVSFVGTSGNSSTESIGLGINRIDRLDGWLVTSKSAYIHNSSFGELKAEWKLSDTAEVTDEGRLIFLVARGEDWRSGNVATLSTKLTTIVSLKVSKTVRYVNQPVPGFENTDTVTAVALVAKF